jgi:ABC-type glutathione transport system ATPase component
VLADEPTGNLDSAAGRDLLQLIQHLNSTSGTTFLIVTHDPSVARMTRRVIVMADGQVQREDRIGSPLEEDLKMWRYSSLGQQIISGSPSDLGWSSEQVALLRKLFVNNG